MHPPTLRQQEMSGALCRPRRLPRSWSSEGHIEVQSAYVKSDAPCHHASIRPRVHLWRVAVRWRRPWCRGLFTSQSFTCKSQQNGEPTSGLEPLTPAPATSLRSVVAKRCRGLQIPHRKGVYCSLYCSLLQAIACGLGSNSGRSGSGAQSLALEIFSNSREPLPRQATSNRFYRGLSKWEGRLFALLANDKRFLIVMGYHDFLSTRLLSVLSPRVIMSSSPATASSAAPIPA